MRFFECFAGIGGFRIGLEKEGFSCVGSCELDKNAAKLYHSYFNTKGEFFKNDIKSIKGEELPRFDCLVGGFPCQAFSISGKQKGFKDERGLLFYELLRIAKHTKPKILFFENVKNLIYHERGRTFAKILFEIWNLGYEFEYAVLNSKDFALPQNRERVFIIGVLRENTAKQILPVLKTLKEVQSTQKLKQIGFLNKNSQSNRIYESEGLACCLKALGGGLGSKTGLYKVKDKIRRLTPLECLRIQGFDDELYFKAKELKISDTQIYKMAGNAVSVNVIQAIAKALKDKLKK